MREKPPLKSGSADDSVTDSTPGAGDSLERSADPERAAETCAGDADDAEIVPVQRQRLADDGRVGTEASRPQAV